MTSKQCCLPHLSKNRGRIKPNTLFVKETGSAISGAIAFQQNRLKPNSATKIVKKYLLEIDFLSKEWTANRKPEGCYGFWGKLFYKLPMLFKHLAYQIFSK